MVTHFFVNYLIKRKVLPVCLPVSDAGWACDSLKPNRRCQKWCYLMSEAKPESTIQFCHVCWTRAWCSSHPSRSPTPLEPSCCEGATPRRKAACKYSRWQSWSLLLQARHQSHEWRGLCTHHSHPSGTGHHQPLRLLTEASTIIRLLEISLSCYAFSKVLTHRIRG